MGFEHFCLAGAGQQGLAAPWSQGCPGDPSEVTVLLPHTPHGPTTAAPTWQRCPKQTPRGHACPAPPPSDRQLILPFLHPKAAGQHQHSNSRHPLGRSHLGVLPSPSCLHPPSPRSNDLLQPETEHVPAAAGITVPAGFRVPWALGLGWGETQVWPAQESLRQTPKWSRGPPGPTPALAPAH